MQPKRLALLGSTGSIGTQALEVVRAHPDKFVIEVLTAHANADLLVAQAREFRPAVVVVSAPHAAPVVQAGLADLPIKVYTDEAALAEVVQSERVEMVLTALVGYCGLRPTLAALRAKKDIALANKETLVVAGELVMALATQTGARIVPVDSEHSAIFQCLVGEAHNPIEKIILTASGGPFRGKTAAELAQVSKAQALKHPNWSMGAKITIDSASLMNKGLEVIEAKWLFALRTEQIEVVVHPQSIIHSIVQFEDGSMKAQMGLPDMKLPIQYALAYPQRISSDFPRFDFVRYPQLTFEQPDHHTFRNLALAYHALARGGNAPCVLNAANEVAVAAFLADKVGFLAMSDIIEACLAKIPFLTQPSYDDYVQTDADTRRLASELLRL